MRQELEEFGESDTIHLIGTCRDWVIYPLFVVFLTNPVHSFSFRSSPDTLLCYASQLKVLSGC